MSRDFRDLLSAFTAQGVEFLVVGAHALAAHGIVRATGDLDVWIRPSGADAERTMSALREFDLPLHDLSSSDLAQEDVEFQIGVAPLRIDILTSITRVEFDEAWRARLETRFAGLPVAVLSRRHIIQNKRTTGRPQDLADVERLERESRDGG